MNHHTVSRRIADEPSAPLARRNRADADDDSGTSTRSPLRHLHEQLMARERERFEIVGWDEA